jgi:hypothetical protein
MVQITAAQFKPEKYSGPDYSRTLLHTMVQITAAYCCIPWSDYSRTLLHTMVQITAAHCCIPWSRLQPHIAAYHGPDYSRTLLHTMVQITAAYCCIPWSRVQPHIAANIFKIQRHANSPQRK